jgi:hypothetical protein
VPSEGQLALERLAAALVEYRIQRDQARSERDQTAEQLAGFEHERDEAEAQRGQTQEAYDRIARELNAHKTRITTLNAENDDLRNLSERYQQDIQILQAQLDELRRERSDLREQLNGTQANIGQDQSDIDTALRLLISVSTRRSTGGQPVPPAWPTNLPFDTENDDPLITGVRLLRLENTQLKQANERQAEQLHATKDELQTYINRTGEIEQATKALEAATSRETADRRIRRHMVAHYLNPNDRSQLLVDIAEMSQQEPELADACRQAEQDVQQTSPNRRPPSTKQPTKKRR